jgi:hypothetical protein
MKKTAIESAPAWQAPVAVRDDKIDLSDIPETTDWSGAVARALCASRDPANQYPAERRGFAQRGQRRCGKRHAVPDLHQVVAARGPRCRDQTAGTEGGKQARREG